MGVSVGGRVGVGGTGVCVSVAGAGVNGTVGCVRLKQLTSSNVNRATIQPGRDNFGIG